MSLHGRQKASDFLLSLTRMSKRFKRCGTDLTDLTDLYWIDTTHLYPSTRAFVLKHRPVIYLKTRPKSFL